MQVRGPIKNIFHTINIKHFKIAKISKGSSFPSKTSNTGLQGGSTDLIHGHINIKEGPSCENGDCEFSFYSRT